MNMNDIEELASLMQCPSCKNCDSLQVKDGEHTFDISIPLSSKTICCKQCGEHYPITDDLIPIMWSDGLKRFFLEINQVDEKSDDMNISANIKVYDDISDDYHSYTRQNADIGNRISTAVKKIFNDKKTEGLLHLDYACGPGHVLEWLKPFGFKRIGLDVSLANLRNSQKNTGCLVICGDACNMPFADDTFNLVTESSALHHILDWESVLAETCRICKSPGGFVLDSEPSQKQMAWSKLAVAFYNARFPIYKILSYIQKDKYIFRDTAKAKLNLQAEIHHQPGTGFPLDSVKSIIEENGFIVDLVVSPTPDLKSRAKPNWKSIVLNFLSARNPWNPDYGSFTVVTTKKASYVTTKKAA